MFGACSKAFLFFLLFLSITAAFSPSDFLKFNKTEAGYGHACSYYTIINPTAISAVADGSNALSVEKWVEANGTLISSLWEIGTLVNTTIRHDNWTCKDVTINGTILQNCTSNPYYTVEQKWSWGYLNTSWISFSPYEKKYVRICGSYFMDISADGVAVASIDHIPRFMNNTYSALSWWSVSYYNSLPAKIENPLEIAVYNKTFKIILNSSYQDYYADNCSDLVVVAEDNSTVMQYGVYLCKQNMSWYNGTENETHLLVWNYTWNSGNTTLYIYMNASGVSSRAVTLSETNNVTLRYDDFEDGVINTESKSAACTIDSTSKLIGTNTTLCTGTSAGLILVFNFTGHSTGNATAEYFLLHNTTAVSCGWRTAFTDSGNNTLKNILYSGAVNGAQCNFQGWRYYSGSYLAYPAPAPPDLDANPRFIQLYFSNDTTQRLGENRTYYGNITMNTNAATWFKIDSGTSTLTHTYYLDQFVVYNSLNNTAYKVFLGTILNQSSVAPEIYNLTLTTYYNSTELKTTLNCTVRIVDNDTATGLSANFTYYLAGIYQNLSSLHTNITNNTNTSDFMNYSGFLEVGQTWNCTVNASDGSLTDEETTALTITGEMLTLVLIFIGLCWGMARYNYVLR